MICQVQTVEQAKDAAANGADVLVAQGAEGGGHGIARGTFALVPAVVDAARGIPVAAAGGVADGRGLAAALMLGADGVLVGTRFYATQEAVGAAAAKERIVAASGDKTIRRILFDIARRNVWPAPYTGRVLRNEFSERWRGREAELMQHQAEEAARYDKARQEGDFDTAAVIAGEGVDMIPTFRRPPKWWSAWRRKPPRCSPARTAIACPSAAEWRSSTVATGPGLVFDVLIDGPDGAPLVLLLHGFAESFHTWDAQIAALAPKYRAVAPSQRGYSPGARPDPADTANYHFDRLVEDAMNIAAACGYGASAFTWSATTGAAVSPGASPTGIRSASPRSRSCHDRIRTPSIVRSRCPTAISSTARVITRAFLEPDAASVVLASDAEWLRVRWKAAGVPAGAMAKHLAVLGNPAAMEAALAWYRARGAIRSPLGKIRVPTLYIWGDADDTVGRPAADGTREEVSGPYEFAVLPGGSHFTADQMPDAVNALLLRHIARNEDVDSPQADHAKRPSIQVSTTRLAAGTGPLPDSLPRPAQCPRRRTARRVTSAARHRGRHSLAVSAEFHQAVSLPRR